MSESFIKETQQNKNIKKAANSLAGTYYALQKLHDLKGKQLEKKTLEAVHLLLEEVKEIEVLDKIILAIDTKEAREALMQAADKLLNRNQPAWHEDQSFVVSVLLYVVMLAVLYEVIFG